MIIICRVIAITYGWRGDNYMHYYKQMKDGKVVAYQSCTGSVTQHDMTEISENEYLCAIEELQKEDEHE